MADGLTHIAIIESMIAIFEKKNIVQSIRVLTEP